MGWHHQVFKEKFGVFFFLPQKDGAVGRMKLNEMDTPSKLTAFAPENMGPPGLSGDEPKLETPSFFGEPCPVLG